MTAVLALLADLLLLLGVVAFGVGSCQLAWEYWTERRKDRAAIAPELLAAMRRGSK